MSAEARSGLRPCEALVRTHDRDRFFCLLFTPADRREALFALHAFELELARIPERISEPLLCAIRLQWWRESLEGIRAGAPRRHEVVLALARAVQDHGLPLDLLERMIDGWDDFLARQEAADLSVLEQEMAQIRGSSVMAALSLLDVTRNDATENLARHAGLALGLTDVLLRAPGRAALGRPVLPRDVLARHGLDLGSLLDGRREERLAHAAAELATSADLHVSAVREHTHLLSRRARTVLLPVGLAAHDLARLRRARFDLFAAKFGHRGAGRQIALLARALRGSP